MKVWKWLAACGLAAVLAACGGGDSSATLPSAQELCGSAGATAKVFNGAECTDYQNSPVVRLAISRSDGNYSCSGTVIAPNSVLTAGHCIKDATSVVVIGYIGEQGYRYVARSWAVHPSFSVSGTGAISYDAAVVTTRQTLPHPSMALLTSSSSNPGQLAFVAGWGLPTYSLTVGAAEIDTVSDVTLSYKYDGQLSDTCVGDSGGPMYRMINGRPGVIGITSYGTVANCGSKGLSVYANTQNNSILSFIRANSPAASVM